MEEDKPQKADPQKLIDYFEMCLENLAEDREPVPWQNPRYVPRDKKKMPEMI